jgi:ubiquinone/menaquinone biosynthesis C-methylase UbiE
MPLLSRFLARARLSRVQKHLGAKILDVGCGYGELLNFLPRCVESVTLLDSSDERLPKLRHRLARMPIPTTFLLGDISQEETGLPSSAFDTVVMAALIEHLKMPNSALRQVHRVLKMGGQLVLTSPMPFGGKLHRLGSRVGLTFPEAAQEHDRFYDRESLARMLEGSGFAIERYERFLWGLNQLVVARKK